MMLCSLLATAFLFAFSEAKTCATERHTMLNYFLLGEKSRWFAELYATRGSTLFKPKQFTNFRLLPAFFEKDDDFSSFSQFFVLNGNFTAQEAWTACNKFDDGARLASLHTAKRLEFVNKLIVGGKYWFGLQRWAGCPTFTWANGEKLGTSNLFWAKNEPQAAASNYDCVRTADPASLKCNETTLMCTADEYAPWLAEKCDSTGFAALCETTYPRHLYGVIKGKFSYESAQKACKSQFAAFPGANLAQAKTESSLNQLFYGTSLTFFKWNCWAGLTRLHEDKVWKHKWADGTWATRFSFLPRLYGNDYSKYDETETCASLHDPAYSASLGFDQKGFYTYNECNAELDCAVCEWQLPL